MTVLLSGNTFTLGKDDVSHHHHQQGPALPRGSHLATVRAGTLMYSKSCVKAVSHFICDDYADADVPVCMT